MVQPGGIGHASTSDTIKAKSKRPCLVVRPAVSCSQGLRIVPPHLSLLSRMHCNVRCCLGPLLHKSVTVQHYRHVSSMLPVRCEKL